MSNPRITGTTHELPFSKLSPRDFERLCLWLVEREGYERAEHLGAAGREQGRDIIAWREGQLWAFQCKRVRNFGPKDALAEVEKVLAIPEEQRPAGLVFLVTCDISANTRQQVRERCAGEMECHFWTGTELDVSVKRYSDIVEEFFQTSGTAYSDSRLPSGIAWSEVKRLCAKVSAPRLEFVAQRFDADLYVHRRAAQAHVNRFLKSESKSYFVLVGRSGMGKSAFLWGLADRMLECSEMACLFCDATIHLKGKKSAAEALLQDLAKALGTPLEDTLRIIQPSDEQAKCRLVFVVDAINEFQSMNDVEGILRDFHSWTIHYPWIRLILSCRPHFWTYVERQQGVIGIADRYFYQPDEDADLFVRLDQLNDEEMVELYGKYRNKYRFDPPHFADLDPRIQRRLREPLMLWLISEVCAEKNISERMDLVLVDVEAIPAYVKKLRERKDLSRQGEDEHFLENTLPKLFVQDDICANYVSRDRIVECCGRKNVEHILRRLLRSGILREDGLQRLSFSFERFYGYYFGLYVRKAANRARALKCDATE